MFRRGFKSWCENTSVGLRKELGLGGSEPLDPFRLAAHLNISVCKASDFAELSERSRKCLFVQDKSSWSAATISWAGSHLIVLNQTHSPARTNSNLTHELSHLIIGHSPSRVDVSEDEVLILHTYDKSQEEQADWLSGCLLLPREALLSILRKKLDNDEATKMFKVSPQMLQYRMNITGVKKQARSPRV